MPLIALLCGLLFGAGLNLSRMTDPAVVQGFLDVTGDWNPALAFVMAGALIPSAIAFTLSRRMRRPVMAGHFAIPAPARIDRKLLTGAVLFGLGWGLVGLCPGPALANLHAGDWPVLVFVAAMAAGMALQAQMAGWQKTAPPKEEELI